MRRTHSIARMAAALLAIALIASCSQEGGDIFYDCIKGNCKMPIKSSVFQNSDFAFFGSGDLPSGTTPVILGAQFSGLAGSGGSGKLTVTSSQELSEVYLQIPGLGGYYVRQVSSADLAYSGNGSYVYSIGLQFGQGSSIGQQLTVGGKTTGQTVSSGISGVTLGGDNCTCGSFQNTDLVFVNGSGTPPGSTAAVQNPQFSGGGTAGGSGTLTFTSSQELSEVYLQIPDQSGYYVRQLSSADCVPGEGGGYTYTIDLEYAQGYGGQQPTVSGVYATTGGGGSSSSGGSGGSHFNPNIDYGSLTDSRDGKTYRTVVIGTQTWMAENLNYDVPGVTTDVCNNNNTANCTTYGRLYDWATAMNGSASSAANPSGVQGVCPEGWHLPSDAEWDVLTTAVGGTGAGGRTGAATPLKAVSGWHTGSSDYIAGTNVSGFSALPGGIHHDIYIIGGWWSSSENGSDIAYNRLMIYAYSDVHRYTNISKTSLYAVRCVKDGNQETFSSSSVAPSSSSVEPSSSSIAPSSSSVAPSSSSVAPSSSSSSIVATCEVEPLVGNHFNPDISYGTLTDSRDGKSYRTVVIGTQTWMAENLKYDVPGNSTDVCYCNNSIACDSYGRLYNWATAMNGSASSAANPSGVQGVCPDGWHLPSSAEWAALTTAVGANPGTKLKAKSGWNTGSSYIAGTDDYGFSALPGGGYNGTSFYDVGNGGYWWGSTENGAGSARYRHMGSGSGVGTYDRIKTYPGSVRCVQD